MYASPHLTHKRRHIIVLVASITLREKVTIYSSSTRILDRVETMLQVDDWKTVVPSLLMFPYEKVGGYKKGKDYLRIDGRVSAEKRGPIVAKFEETASIRAILISSEDCFVFLFFFRRLQLAWCYWIAISTLLFRLNVYRDPGA
mmetsp:Transcript_26480/g.63041  ORF Transcript_26480/g.63041 Transcript_26480/m.63041 type:complete len:144 (-) Transcript_26480:1267-1698(-)